MTALRPNLEAMRHARGNLEVITDLAHLVRLSIDHHDFLPHQDIGGSSAGMGVPGYPGAT